MDFSRCGAWASDHGYDQNRCMWVPNSIRDAVAAGNSGISSRAPTFECIWDMTGCSADCDETKMTTRCATLSQDQDICESQIGKDYRCKWSHGEEQSQSLMDSVKSTVENTWRGIVDEDITSTDMLLGLSLFVSMVFAMYQCYQSKCGGHGEYEKLRDGPAAPVMV